ncbi:phosphopantetheine-binding protein [Actinosynnema sp. NPDC047251]|uniref:Amino acid thiolation domain containing protein n=1 Tax=Saccharothrix espanaensis (strain ATCC 51144 / DSM 44229 / JCM 9112 / NBRC 15066 / NRRL 15764) TaxID=1179773 RepID=K0JXI8_SACES|nr:phosphopantetheine-binding protein [Saccharothrix espanaensis]CCH30836.1 Amino acid thiolation domain containing protein [Saccharothrix espanaensis DSM 44229]
MSAAALAYEEVVVRVREIWADVLGSDSADDVPLEVNFLECGGNSLLLVMLWEELQPIASRPVKLSELFHHGTVRAQAELLVGAPVAEPEPLAAVTVVADASPRSLLAQRRAAASSGGVG